MISDNPTKTRGIEKKWRAEINRRWREFTRVTIGELVKQHQLTVNAFDVDPVQLRAYIAYFQQQIDLILLGEWQDKYQLRAYELAVSRAMDELRRTGARLDITDTDRQLAARISSFTATSALGVSALDITRFPIHQETLEFLFTRSFESLNGYTIKMAREVRGILFAGVEQGLGIDQITRQIKDRIGVSRTGARLVAQTETIQAYQRGSINQAQLAGDFLGETVNLRWLTRRDVKVRPLHVGFHGQVMSVKQSRQNIAISPYRCRCGLIPVIAESNTPKENKLFAEQRQQLKALTP